MRDIGTLAVAGLILSACGATTGEGPATLSGYGDAANAIAADLRADGHYFVTPGRDIPTSGSAVYEGVVGFDAYSGGTIEESYAGRMAVTADFNAFPGDTFSGGASDFVDSRDRPVDGRLDVTYGNIDRAADPVLADQVLMNLGGTLRDHRDVDLAISATADGVFLGPAVQGIDGVIEGTMTSTYGVEAIRGDYILAR